MRKKKKQLNEFKVTWIDMKGTLKMISNKVKEGKRTVAREGCENKCEC